MGKPIKRRKVSTVEEISFDTTAREEFLTGFHKRKQQRILQAREQAARREREEKIKERKRVHRLLEVSRFIQANSLIISLISLLSQIRDERKQELEAQLAAANARLTIAAGQNDIEQSTSEIEADEESESVSDQQEAENGKEPFRAEEYIDEEKYTTVTVEPVEITKHGTAALESPTRNDDPTHIDVSSTAKGSNRKGAGGGSSIKDRAQRLKPRGKKKFRYESAGERKKTRAKIKIKKSLHSLKRRNNQ